MKNRAALLLAIATVMFSLGGVLIKLSSWNGPALNGARSLAAAGIIGVYLWWSNESLWQFSRLQVAGAIVYVLTNLTFVMSTQQTTAANAIFLQFTAPIWVALLGMWFLKERPQRIDWIALVLILIGMGLLFSGDLVAENMQGNLIAVISGVCLAVLVIIMRKQQDGVPARTIFLGNLIAAAVGLPFAIGGDVAVNTTEIGIILLLGFFQLGLPFILYSFAIKHLRAIEAILIQTLEPIFNPIWVALVVAEIPSPTALLGCLVVILTVTLRGVLTRPR